MEESFLRRDVPQKPQETTQDQSLTSIMDSNSHDLDQRRELISNHPPLTSLQDRTNITIEPYVGEHQMGSIINLIEKELSEPYIVYTYRYFVNQWPNLCFFAYASRSSLTSTPASTTHSSNSSSSTLDSVAKHMNVANISEERERSHSDTHPPRTEQPAGVIVCKQDRHLKGTTRLMRGYIAMISVKTTHRGQGLAKQLVRRAVKEMVKLGAQEVVLETEADNEAALGLYESLGFVREKRLHRFYLNGKDSFRLVLPVPRVSQQAISPEMDLPPPMGLIQPPYPAASQPQRPNFQTDKFSSGSITQ